MKITHQNTAWAGDDNTAPCEQIEQELADAIFWGEYLGLTEKARRRCRMSWPRQASFRTC
jgi:hypothetical protein